MNDVERELTEMFERREAGVRGPAFAPSRAPRALVRRARRRQLATVVGGALLMALAVVAAFTGLRAIADGDHLTPAAPPAQGTVNGITMTYPETWSLIDPIAAGIEPGTEPPRLVLMLSTYTSTSLGAQGCPGMTGDPSGGLLLTVQDLPLALAGEGSTPWPVQLEPLDISSSRSSTELDPSACYPGWAFEHARWTASGRTFEARAGFGPDTSEADRNALLDAFASMTFEPTPGGPTAAVVATGTAGVEAWELVVSRMADGPSLSLEWSSGGSGIGGFTGGEQGDLQGAQATLGSGADAQTVVFGEVSKHVSRLEVVLGTDAPTPVEIIDAPDDLAGPVDVFVVTVEAGRDGMLNAYDAAGELLQSIAVNAGDGEAGVETATVAPSG